MSPSLLIYLLQNYLAKITQNEEMQRLIMHTSEVLQMMSSKQKPLLHK
jgi:hypothetical protein